MKFPEPGTFNVIDFPPADTMTGNVAEHTEVFSPGASFDPAIFDKPVPASMFAGLDIGKGDYSAFIPYPAKEAVKPKSGHQPVDPWAPKKAETANVKLGQDALTMAELATVMKKVSLDIESYGKSLSDFSEKMAWQSMYMNDFSAITSDPYLTELKYFNEPGFNTWPGTLSKQVVPLPPKGLDIPYRPFQPKELSSVKAFKQAFFDRAVEAMAIQQATAHTGLLNSCRYRSDSGARCVVGWMIPDETYDPSLEGKAASQSPVLKALGLPLSFGTSREGDFMQAVQRLLHDSLVECETREALNEKFMKNVKFLAGLHDLQINLPVR